MGNPKILLIGQPNAGKSTIFNVLSDLKSHSSNFSGTSIEITQSEIDLDGKTYTLVDLPGVYSLNPGDEAEKVTFQFLREETYELIINVVDATLLARSLELTVEMLEFGKPMVIALNMWDEAKRKGLKIYPERLEKALNIPVVSTSALHGKGIKRLLENSRMVLKGGGREKIESAKYTSHIEKCVQQIAEKFKGVDYSENGSPRFYSIKAIENPEIVPQELLTLVEKDLEKTRKEICDMHEKDAYESISYERHHLSMKLTEEISHFFDTKTIPFREKLDQSFLHPYWGFIPLLAFFFVFFATIYFVGNFLGALIEPPLDQISNLYAGLAQSQPFWWFTLDGIYQGVVGAIGIVLPYFLPLIFLIALFEDTGYLARIAFLLDGFMHKIGLHGKSVAPFVLGFGCTVPALYGIRILENKRDRDLTAILLPFIPCSARTTVILALTAAFTGPWWAMFIYAFIVLVLGVTGKVMSFFMGKPTGLILEIPDLKVPSLRVSFTKTWLKMKDFLKFAVPFLIIGSIIMGWLEYFRLNQFIDKVLAPMVNGVMGLPDALGTTLVFGFFRKELVLVMANNAFGVDHFNLLPLTPEQVIVFVVFVTLYFPCFSTFVMMWKEFGKRIVLISSILSVLAALISAFILRLILT